MKSTKTTATVRTITPGLWGSAVVYVFARLLGRQPDATELAIILAAAPVVAGVIYRVVRELDARWPWVGRVFLGSAKAPAVYASPEVAAVIDASGEKREDAAKMATAVARYEGSN